MATKSSNTKGNPYHDEKSGQFTEANATNSGSEQTQETKTQLKISANFDLQEMKNDLKKSNDDTNKNVKSFKLKLKSSIEDAKKELAEKNQVSSIPMLSSARDVYENIEQFFTDSVIKNIDSKFGKFRIPYKFYNLRTDPQQRCGVNIFAACIGKVRWSNNYLRIIDKNEYNKLSKEFRFQNLYRGLNCNDDKEFETIANSYSSVENEMIYGSVGGVAYGIAVYASNREYEAVSYARGNREHVMKLMLDKGAKTLSYRKIRNITNGLIQYRDEIVSKVKDIFVKRGIEDSRATQMARSFGITMGDEGFVAMLCGVEWYSNEDSYHMIENLGALYRLL